MMGEKAISPPPPLCKPGYFCLTCPYPSCIRPSRFCNTTQEEIYMLSLVGMAHIGKQRKKEPGDETSGQHVRKTYWLWLLYHRLE